MTLPRVLHRIYARCAGYFWKPCPICKREFGGHEAATILLYVSPGNSVMVCEVCEFEAVSRNTFRLTLSYLPPLPSESMSVAERLLYSHMFRTRSQNDSIVASGRVVSVHMRDMLNQGGIDLGDTP